jgi:hypothetical protein
MSGRPGSRAKLSGALAVAVLATVLRFGVDAEVLLWCAPAILLVAPLIVGRFLGEDVLGARRLRRAIPRPRRAAATVRLPRRAPHAVSHRGRLLAFRLAERGPPASALVA